jgi:hypothetical protein
MEAVSSDNVFQPKFSGNGFPTGGFKETGTARLVQRDWFRETGSERAGSERLVQRDWFREIRSS